MSLTHRSANTPFKSSLVMTTGAHIGIFNSLCIASFPSKIPGTPVCPLGMTWLCSLGYQSHSDWPQTSHWLPCPAHSMNCSTSGHTVMLELLSLHQVPRFIHNVNTFSHPEPPDLFILLVSSGPFSSTVS